MEKSTKEKSTPLNVLKDIERIAFFAKASGLSRSFRRNVHDSTKRVAEFLGCSEEQTIFFSVILLLNFKRAYVELDDMASYMECSPLYIARKMHDLDQMLQLQLIRKDCVPSRLGRCTKRLDSIRYFISSDIFDAIANGYQINLPREKITDPVEFLFRIGVIIESHDNNEITFHEMKDEIISLLNENGELPLVRNIISFGLEEENLFILLYICDRFIQDESEVDFVETIKKVEPDLVIQLKIRKEFISGDNELLGLELVKLEESIFASDRTISLTEKAIDMFLSDHKDLFFNKNKKNQVQVRFAEEIAVKQLYFSEEENKNIRFLTESLMPGNYEEICTRLKENGMNQGFSALFYGAPGTGKTECALQIARQTGRDLKEVIISETKSHWFGESEKRIKKVFDDYRRLVHSCSVTPILMFNEADGILGKRKTVGYSAVDQTENAIQNIILDEMENLNGILIATTNMTVNLDKAFERRFHFKIQFFKPEQQARFQIWRDKLPGLNEEYVRRLSEKFDLSGGQIDNIVRKYLMAHILRGDIPDLNEIMKFCEEENLVTREKKLGFRMAK